VRYENVAEVLAHGPTRTTVVLRSGLQVDVRAVPEESYGAALLYFTGSKAHNIAAGARQRAQVEAQRIRLFSGRRRIAGATEEEVYKKLGLAFIPPELREDRGEVALAKANRLPRLVTVDDIAAICTSIPIGPTAPRPSRRWRPAAQARGYEYMALTDHSRRVAMVHGLDPARLRGRSVKSTA
jgi:DNA polymerase (family X)